MKRWRAVHVVELLLLTIGICCLGWFGWNWFATEIDQRWASYELDRQIQSRHSLVEKSIRESISRRATEDSQRSDTTGSSRQAETAETEEKQPKSEPGTRRARYLERGDIIGRVEIPRLNLKAVVRYGVDDTTLKRAVGFIPGTALPGQPGNVGVAAHRDTHFRNLRGVTKGDIIRFTTRFGAHEYKVESLSIVLPKDTEVLHPTSEPSLTLVTCYPFDYVGSAPKRFIVRAKEIIKDPSPAPVVAKRS